MKNIEKVLICGIGAIGSIYANQISEYDNKNLRILVDEKRLQNYTKNPKIFNGKPLNLNYVLSDETGYKADLIIIATKFDGLFDTVKNIKNFVKQDTVIISLLNGVTSEEIIAAGYGWTNLPLAYYIGHSAMREGSNIVHDGIGMIVFGIKDPTQTNPQCVTRIKNYFDKVGIKYKNPEDMLHSYWLKYMLNVGSNQPSAILGMTFGQMQSNKKFKEFFINIMKEVQIAAKFEGVKNTETMIDEALASFAKMSPNGKTSMLQDVEAKRKTEVEMFAGTMIKFGEKYNFPTPYNHVLKEMFEVIHENFTN